MSTDTLLLLAGAPSKCGLWATVAKLSGCCHAPVVGARSPKGSMSPN
jgi:hypothetical protein